MTTIEIKHNIVNQINKLSKNKLHELQGVLNNFENEKVEFEDWVNLLPEQKLKIQESMHQIKNGKIYSHDDVIERLRTVSKNA
jgi:hypothetical protein